MGASRSTRAPSDAGSGAVKFRPGSGGSAPQAASLAASPGASEVTGWRRPSAVRRGRKGSAVSPIPSAGFTARMSPTGVPA